MILSTCWLIVCLLGWLGAVTIGLPLTLALKFSQTFRRAFFSWQFVRLVGPFFQPRTEPARKRTFEILKGSLRSRDVSRPLEALEIGIGGGANLKYYPENVNLSVLDVNKYFEVYFNENMRKFPQISFRRTVIQAAEDMSQVADDSLDLVVSSYFQCSCDDSEVVLKEVKRVLKSGGKYVFLEHVPFPTGEVGLTVQRLINPIWPLYFGGCTLLPDTADKIRRAGFADVICEEFVENNWLLFLIRHQIVGVAVK